MKPNNKNTSSSLTKNTEKQLVRLLTDICEQHKFITHGFNWLTHTLDNKSRMTSLQVICVFEDQQALNQATLTKQTDQLRDDILIALQTLNINISAADKLVKFGIEEHYQGYQ
ncbi:hypothetical protein RGQ13_04635 [Thalassotalea psychrophila]|uniref:Fis family transcriptional regulator n=1 Tax=Thalassotalea psychrophila TaxID=3065647 RepID=A0ABY9TWV1_9GAMM|nr:hypothetical protein RGQ13_04635 [Colwelliaceae bacterium SQ149]